jgi:hypothetical protein
MASEPNNKLLTPIKLFLEIPLYKVFSTSISTSIWDDGDTFSVQHVENFQGMIDTFCMTCKKHSTFRRVDTEQEDYDRNNHSDNVFCVPFVCTRDDSHDMYFYFRKHNGTIQKIGQYPSLADLNSGDIGKYRRMLDEEKYKEFSKAVGLASHGVGIGSFVYLRRIFENLIEEAHQEAIKTNSWNEDHYKTKRMDEKIGLLKDYLPEFLVKNKIIYSILSKGIHELSEDKCLKFFDPVKLGIELILDEKLEKLDREAKIKKAEKSLSEIPSELK